MSSKPNPFSATKPNAKNEAAEALEKYVRDEYGTKTGSVELRKQIAEQLGLATIAEIDPSKMDEYKAILANPDKAKTSTDESPMAEPTTAQEDGDSGEIDALKAQIEGLKSQLAKASKDGYKSAEAPASVNLYLEVNGAVLQFTVRGNDPIAVYGEVRALMGHLYSASEVKTMASLGGNSLSVVRQIKGEKPTPPPAPQNANAAQATPKKFGGQGSGFGKQGTPQSAKPGAGNREAWGFKAIPTDDGDNISAVAFYAQDGASIGRVKQAAGKIFQAAVRAINGAGVEYGPNQQVSCNRAFANLTITMKSTNDGTTFPSITFVQPIMGV